MRKRSNRSIKITSIKVESKECKTTTEIYEKIILWKVDHILKRLFEHFWEKLNIPYKNIDDFKIDLLKKNYNNIQEESNKNITKILKILENNQKIIKWLDNSLITDFVKKYSEKWTYSVEKCWKIGLEEKFKKEYIELYKKNLKDKEKSDDNKIEFLQQNINILDHNSFKKEIFNLFESFENYNKLLTFLQKNKLRLEIVLDNSEYIDKIKNKIIRYTKNDSSKKYWDFKYLEENINFLVTTNQLCDFIYKENNKEEKNEYKNKIMIFLKNIELVKKIDYMTLSNIISNLYLLWFSEDEKIEIYKNLIKNNIYKKNFIVYLKILNDNI